VHHLHRHATSWIEIRAGRVRVRKGMIAGSRIRAIEAMIEGEELPAHTAVWVTAARRVHFKPNFPHFLRDAVGSELL